VPFLCAIAPLDQAATQLGWHQGSFTRRPCPLISSCVTRQEGLQFLADAGTPVVAPFDARVVREGAGLLLVVQFDVPRAIAIPPVHVRITGIAPEVGNGPVQKGALLGRVARGARPAATFELVGGSMEALFADLGLDVVGGERRPMTGFALTPSQGGRLLARASGPANCGSAGLHGLFEPRGLGSVAPSGYVEPDGSVYGRFGTSRLSNTNVSVPSGSTPSGGLWSLVAWVGIGGVVWAATKR
jgi:hypothetical protein